MVLICETDQLATSLQAYFCDRSKINVSGNIGFPNPFEDIFLAALISVCVESSFGS